LLFGITQGQVSEWVRRVTAVAGQLIPLRLVYASLPVGVVLFLVAPRFSIVEGLAGGEGCDEPDRRTSLWSEPLPRRVIRRLQSHEH